LLFLGSITGEKRGFHPVVENGDMKRVLVPLANGCEEIEAVAIIDVLRRAHLHVVVAGVGARTLIGSHRIAVTADRSIEEVGGEEFDLIVLPGGMPGTAELATSTVLGEMLIKQNEAGRLIGAICAAPTLLEQLGLLEGKRVTTHYSVKDRIVSGTYTEDRVVQDGNIITSQGAGTAIEFSLKLVEEMCGSRTAERIEHAVIAHTSTAVPKKE
jgi:4-methyl-5(b-hydroxyethyl)-thiazole monophosphate biosynthesis